MHQGLKKEKITEGEEIMQQAGKKWKETSRSG